MRKNVKEGNLRIIEKDNWQLAYTEEFKAFVHEHPSVIRDVVTKLGKLANSDPKGGELLKKGV